MTCLFHPILFWAISGASFGAGTSAAATFAYLWLTNLTLYPELIQHNAGLGAFVGLHLGLFIAYLRSYQDEVPATWEVTRREPLSIVFAGILLVYAICWIAISL